MAGWAHHVKRWRNPWNRKYTAHCIIVVNDMHSRLREIWICRVLLWRRQESEILWWARMSVCLYVCSYVGYISETTSPNFAKFSTHAVCDHGSILFWRRYNILCISGFVDDSTPYGVVTLPQRSPCRVFIRPGWRHVPIIVPTAAWRMFFRISK